MDSAGYIPHPHAPCTVKCCTPRAASTARRASRHCAASSRRVRCTPSGLHASAAFLGSRPCAATAVAVRSSNGAHLLVANTHLDHVGVRSRRHSRPPAPPPRMLGYSEYPVSLSAAQRRSACGRSTSFGCAPFPPARPPLPPQTGLEVLPVSAPRHEYSSTLPSARPPARPCRRRPG